jgi:hypothetical protein
MTLKLNTLFLTCILLTAALSGCKDDEQVTPDKEAIACHIVKVIDINDVDSTTSTFGYNTDNQLSATNSPWLEGGLAVSYKNGRVSQMSLGLTDVVMTYEPGSYLPLRATIIDAGDTAGQISFIPGPYGISRLEFSYIDDETNTLELDAEYNFAFTESGSLSKVTYYTTDEFGALVKESEYSDIVTDGKINPITTDQALTIFYAIDEEILLLGTDNVVSARYENFQFKEVLELQNTINYNELNYPLDLSSTAFGIRKQIFEYSCE